MTDTAVLSPAVVHTAPMRRPDYRLTRRGRLVVFVVALLALLAIGVALASGSVASSEAPETTTIVVVPGDTLWDIATDVDPEGDVRDTMALIEELNDLDGPELSVGQQLVVPA